MVQKGSMRWFRRKPQQVASPLWDFVAEHDVKSVARYLDEEVSRAETGKALLTKAISSLGLACAADFQENVGRVVRNGLPKANADVIAFEGLAYSIVAIRFFHLPPYGLEEGYELDDEVDEPEVLIDAYRDAIAILRVLVERQTGWSIRKEWEARILQHAQFHHINEAMERLNGKLLSVEGFEKPPIVYEQPRENLPLSFEVIGGTHAFTTTMPKAVAETIKGLISEYALLD